MATNSGSGGRPEGATPPANPLPNPGDQAAPGTPQTGEVPCPDCHGSGRAEGRPCRNCGGSGRVVQIVGDA